MTNRPIIQIFKIIALTLTLIFLVTGYLTIISKRSGITQSGIAVIPTESLVSANNTKSAPSATSTREPSPTNTATHTPSATTKPTLTSTSTPTVKPTLVNSATPTITPTSDATSTPTNTITSTQVLTNTPTPEATPTETPAGPPTETSTPTVTPTPVPRTISAIDAPDYTLAEPHFWFTRPYTAVHDTQGSWFYPYGTNNYGEYLWHHGIDIQNSEGIPILAVGDGVVLFADVDSARAIGPQVDFYGQAVIIQHSNAWTLGEEQLQVYTLYGHVSQLLVAEGESVITGQPIALTGQEGIALGPHLHLEVRTGENSYLATQNPDLWISPDEGQGVIAGRIVDVNGFYVPQQLVTLHRAIEPDRFWRQTWTYPDNLYQFDSQLGETFTFADVPVGEYIVKTTFDGRNYSFPITVSNRQTTFVNIAGEAAPPPPTPEATVAPEVPTEVEVTPTTEG